jgi:hypothetical protein
VPIDTEGVARIRTFLLGTLLPGSPYLLDIAQFQKRCLNRQALALHNRADRRRKFRSECVFVVPQGVFLACFTVGQKSSSVLRPDTLLQFAPPGVLNSALVSGVGRVTAQLDDLSRQFVREVRPLPCNPDEPRPEIVIMGSLRRLYFPTSCNASAQKWISRGFALFHSFGYEQARGWRSTKPRTRIPPAPMLIGGGQDLGTTPYRPGVFR